MGKSVRYNNSRADLLNKVLIALVHLYTYVKRPFTIDIWSQGVLEIDPRPSNTNDINNYDYVVAIAPAGKTSTLALKNIRFGYRTPSPSLLALPPRRGKFLRRIFVE